MKMTLMRIGQTVRSGLGWALVLAALAGSAHATVPVSTPEIDPGSMGSALTLLLGGAFLLTGRSRKG
jgi:hypothetical protein